VFATGQGCKTDATGAHSVALAATRMTGLRQVAGDQQLAVLRILAGRRRSLGEDHTRSLLGWNDQGGLHLHLHVIPRFDDEPMADHGVRSGIKDPANRRPDPWRPGTGRHMAGS
jgi:diadenosine tetraphosphate (Ap4A) HIT family hydrolase